MALACATVLSRLPLLAPRLAHWDAVNYALGLHDFNVAAHQPHPPGSPYFILLGRLALAVTADDNAALILVSLVASVGAVMRSSSRMTGTSCRPTANRMIDLRIWIHHCS